MKQSTFFKLLFTNGNNTIMQAPIGMTNDEVRAAYLKDIGLYEDEEIESVVEMTDEQIKNQNVLDEDDGITYSLLDYAEKYQFPLPAAMCSSDW